MSFADVNRLDARHCAFQNAGRNIVNITLQVLPSSPLSTESQSQGLTDAITLSSAQNNREPLIALLHTHPSSLHLITAIAPLLDLDIIHRRDFLRDLPSALALRIIDFVDDPRTIVYMSQVNKLWRSLLSDKRIWRMMCSTFGFDADLVEAAAYALVGDEGAPDQTNDIATPIEPALKWLITLAILPTSARSPPFVHAETTFSYRKYLKSYYETTVLNWRRAAHLVCPRLPVAPLEGSTNTALPEEEWVVLASHQTVDPEIG